MTALARPSLWRGRITLLLAILILVPSLFGFGSKFVEFLHVYWGDPTGGFAVTPIVNYLLASVGFLLMFGWAAANGMFHDIEGPKQSMLDNEDRLNQSRR